MYDVKELRTMLQDYSEICANDNTKPTKGGLSKFLGISISTLFNVLRGEYNGGIPYGEKPSYTRCISNSGFTLIRSFFGLNEDA